MKLLREIGESDSKEIAIEELCPESCDCMVVVKPYSDLDEFDFDRRTRSLLRKTGIRNERKCRHERPSGT